jgi:O-antigen/teichoic acid export membrane protein
MSTRIIARNSLWYGLETGLGFASGLFTSIAIARVLGPEKLGPFVYVGWLTNVAASLGGLGIPAATSKYMGEYLGRGEPGTARAIFFLTLRLQTMLAVFLTALALVVVRAVVDPSRFAFAAFLAAAMLPAMINFIPAQAFAAAEDLGANVPASLAGNITYVTGVVLVLSMGWGLVGLGVTVLCMTIVEMLFRLIPAVKRFRRFPEGQLPPEVRRKLFAFSRQNVLLLLLSAIVWDRSEILFLQHFSDVRQVAFYSVVFNISERARIIPMIFGSAVNPTILAQYGRDPVRLNGIVSNAVRYLGLVTLPVNLGIAVLSAPLIHLLYGSRYLEAIPLMMVAMVLAIPKALLAPVSSLMGATENQNIVVRWTVVVAILNVALDFWLIRAHAAMGAVIANGVAQTVMALALFLRASKLLDLRFPVRPFFKIALSAGVMAVAIRLIPMDRWSPLASLPAGALAGGAVFLLMLRLTGSLEAQDGARLEQLRGRLPAWLRPWVDRGAALLIPDFPAAKAM